MSDFRRKRNAWIRAVADERHYWPIDRPLVDEMNGQWPPESDLEDLIRRIVIQYRVARNFPLSKRHAFAKEFRCTADSVKHAGTGCWFDECVRTIRRLAKSTAKQWGQQPFVGISKVLWHRHPMRAFIYDSEAFEALKGIGPLPSYQQYLSRWGGNAASFGERKFLRFAAGYHQHFLALHEPIADVLRETGRDPRRSARVIDKLLWHPRATGERPNDDDRRIADAAVAAVEGRLLT
jgi:hypothetical protein